jgi:hypothetical protein
MRDIFGFEQTGVRDGCAVGHFYATGHTPKLIERFGAAGIELSPDLFTQRYLLTENDSAHQNGEVIHA